MRRYSFLLLFNLLLGTSMLAQATLAHGDLVLNISSDLKTSIGNKATGNALLMQDLRETEYLVIRGGTIGGFRQEGEMTLKKDAQANTRTFVGKNEHGIIKILTIKELNNQPGLFALVATYVNGGEKTFDVTGWVNHDYLLSPKGDSPDFWSFQGSSTSARSNWIQPVEGVFYNKNYLGMNNSDYGGGIPVVDLWRRDGGLAIGHLELVPKLVSLPVEKLRHEATTRVRVEYEYPWAVEFKPGDTLATFETFVAAHRGDCFSALRQFSEVMQERGIQLKDSPPSAYEPMWCAWGYERNFTLDEVIGTLPKVKEMGIKWATLDDGFQITEGDWTTNPQKFPNGAADMRRLTKAIHDAGLKAQIWWAPLAVSPDSRLLQEQPSVLLRTEEYAPQFITWWDAWYMAPTSPATLQHTKDVVTLFIQDWDFDGLKLDGQHLNAVLPDHGEGHGIENPEEACERLPDFFHAIYNTAAAIKPDVLVQHCPCGTCMSYYNLPTTNQTVSSDPVGSIQIRQKGKVYKAIAPQVAYFGDHVELSDGGNDFASSFGVGAVLGTKFTWPKDNPTVKPGYLLTPEKERAWKKWFSLYNEKMLSKEPYLGQLYDIGYDLPEAHAIQKGNIMYYAFYAEKWDGVLELRGLHKGKRYKVRDYINGKEWGQVTAENPSLKVAFEQSLLLEVSAL